MYNLVNLQMYSLAVVYCSKIGSIDLCLCSEFCKTNYLYNKPVFLEIDVDAAEAKIDKFYIMSITYSILCMFCDE